MHAISEKPDNIVMRRPNLEGLPPPVAPPGCTLRTYRDGDEPAWGALLAAAFADHTDMLTLPRREFLGSPLWRPDRIHFACRDGVPVACTAAWEATDRFGPRVGLIHWVATHPDHLRRGLARACVVAALHWMHGCYDASALVTQTHRVPAIRLYLDLGFEPWMEAFADMPSRWAKVSLPR